MTGRALRLALAGGVLAWLADAWLAARWRARGEDGPAPIRTRVAIEAPAGEVWAVVADVERQPTWMTDLRSVRLETPGPPAVGSRAVGQVRILGIGVGDPVTITELAPPARFGIRHDGPFAGDGLIELRPGADGRSTIVTWTERLRAPLLPELFAAIVGPVLRRVFQADLHRLRGQLEEPARPGAAPAAAGSHPAAPG